MKDRNDRFKECMRSESFEVSNDKKESKEIFEQMKKLLDVTCNTKPSLLSSHSQTDPVEIKNQSDENQINENKSDGMAKVH